MILLLLLLIFVYGVLLFINRTVEDRNWKLNLNAKKAFLWLLFWIAFGFITRLDYSEAWGCLVAHEPVFELKNVLFSSISFVLILLAFKVKNVRLKKVLCVGELSYWILKLVIFKGGYVVGFGGLPSVSILFYDLVAILARLFLLNRFFLLTKFKLVHTTGIVFLILSLKIFFFSIPLNMIYEERKTQEKAQEIRKGLIGNWKGTVRDMKNNLGKVVFVKIDSTSLFFDKVIGLESKYQFILNYPKHGSLIKGRNSSNLNLSIIKLEKDSFVLAIHDIPNIYILRLKKE